MSKCLDDVDFVEFISSFDLFFISETWQKEPENFKIDGYESYCVPRSESLNKKLKRGHGGVCLFYKSVISDGLSVIETDLHGIIWVKLCKQFFNLNEDFYICFAYIPPQNSVYYTLHPTGFFEAIESGMRKYSVLGKTALIGDLNSRCGNRSDCLHSTNNFNRFIPVIETDCNSGDMNVLPERSSVDTVTNALGLKLIELCLSTDLRIVNGRFNNSGQYTFMSSNGNSLIDYVLLSEDMFPVIKRFTVHDISTFSPHRPISIDLYMSYEQSNTAPKFVEVERLIWDSDKREEFVQSVQSDLPVLNSVVDNIVCNNLNIDSGISEISDTLYNNAFCIFGQKKKIFTNKNTSKRKFTSPWYNNECEEARRNLKKANRVYASDQSQRNADVLLTNRRLFRIAKRRARFKYNAAQKRKLHNFAKSQPQRFWKEIKKLRKKCTSNPLTKDDFFNHFKSLFSESDVFVNEHVENLVQNEEFMCQNVDDHLDIDFTEDDVLKAISSLKSGKSGSVDLLIPEIFISCKTLLAAPLCKLFNYMFNNALYPDSWMKGIIVPVPKKGCQNDVNNYRGITLTSVFSKIFSIMLDMRLRQWANDNNVLNENQFGFVKGKGTVDCIYVLTSIIDKIIRKENKKLYCSFVDFKKCFDYVYRNGIWCKLIQQGVSSKMVKMLQSMYNSVKSCVRVNGVLSDYFDSYMGVKQGEPLSPLLFVFFVNDMYKSFQGDDNDIFTLDEIQIFLLLFADDTVLFSYTKEGLQRLLNNMFSYCTQWGITVNTDKTVTMVFKKGTRPENFDVFYNGIKLTSVSYFTYLGVTLSFNGSFYRAQKALASQALKSLYSLNSLFDTIPLDISEKIKLFDSMVSPILSYGSEVWGFHISPDIENVHIKFLKQLLGVNSRTCKNSVYGEFGRYPLLVLRRIKIIKYWLRIKQCPNSIMYKLMYLKNNNNNYVNTWTQKVQSLLNNLGLGYMWELRSLDDININTIIQRIYDNYLQSWFSEIEAFSKLQTYKVFKNEFGMEKYLLCVKNDKHRISLSRLRCSSHRLAIEEGRYRNIERSNRICKFCNMNQVETEYHFLLVCPFYNSLREKYIKRYYRTWPTTTKFKALMSSNVKSTICNLAAYVYFATRARETYALTD